MPVSPRLNIVIVGGGALSLYIINVRESMTVYLRKFSAPGKACINTLSRRIIWIRLTWEYLPHTATWWPILLYPDSRMVVILFMARARWRSGIPPGRYSFCPVVYLYSHIVLQHRLLPDLFRGPKKLSRTELPLAGTHVGNHPDSDNLDIASQGRNFYRVVAARAIYGAFHIRPFTAVYHSGSLYRSDRPIVVAVL